jgi:hypothetical protein
VDRLKRELDSVKTESKSKDGLINMLEARKGVAASTSPTRATNELRHANRKIEKLQRKLKAGGGNEKLEALVQTLQLQNSERLHEIESLER